jgi:hypothetical protein
VRQDAPPREGEHRAGDPAGVDVPLKARVYPRKTLGIEAERAC